jgi:hypothetical protein
MVINGSRVVAGVKLPHSRESVKVKVDIGRLMWTDESNDPMVGKREPKGYPQAGGIAALLILKNSKDLDGHQSSKWR